MQAPGCAFTRSSAQALAGQEGPGSGTSRLQDGFAGQPEDVFAHLPRELRITVDEAEGTHTYTGQPVSVCGPAVDGMSPVPCMELPLRVAGSSAAVPSVLKRHGRPLSGPSHAPPRTPCL